MLSKRDIRVIMLYEFKRGTIAAKTTQEINRIFGENFVNVSTVQRWFKKFKEGNKSLENEERGRPDSSIDNDELRKAVEANPRTTVRALAKEFNVSRTTISRHLKEIEKTKKFNKWVPYELNYYQKMCRYEFCSSLILRNKNDPFLKRLVICDEKWFLCESRKRTRKWLDKDKAPKQFPKHKLFSKKVMVIIWWSVVGVIHYKFMKPGESITSESFCQQLEEMHKKLSQKMPTIINRKKPILLHNNVRPYVSKMTLQKLYELGYETLPYPTYSPDLAPSNFHFSKHLDNFLTEKNFVNYDDIKTTFEDFIESKSPDFYANGINKFVSRCQQCADYNGFYFE